MKGVCFNHAVAKRKRKSVQYRDQWMRDKDLRSVVLFITVVLLVLCLVILYILAIIDPKGYILLLSPVIYLFNLYHHASPGEKLTILYLPVGGIIGWYLKQWLSKKR